RAPVHDVRGPAAVRCARRALPRSRGGHGGGLAVELTVLGCSGSYNAPPAGACSGYLLRDGDTSIWMDCGHGSFTNLQRQLDPGELSAVVITHEHSDHCVDIYGLHVLLRYALERAGVPVYAPGGADERLGTLANWGDT